jgi:hypothetical protein
MPLFRKACYLWQDPYPLGCIDFSTEEGMFSTEWGMFSTEGDCFRLNSECYQLMFVLLRRVPKYFQLTLIKWGMFSTAFGMFSDEGVHS